MTIDSDSNLGLSSLSRCSDWLRLQEEVTASPQEAAVPSDAIWLAPTFPSALSKLMTRFQPSVVGKPKLSFCDSVERLVSNIPLRTEGLSVLPPDPPTDDGSQAPGSSVPLPTQTSSARLLPCFLFLFLFHSIFQVSFYPLPCSSRLTSLPTSPTISGAPQLYLTTYKIQPWFSGADVAGVPLSSANSPKCITPRLIWVF